MQPMHAERRVAMLAWPRALMQLLEEVVPMRIGLLDQIELQFALVLLDRFFALDRLDDQLMWLVPDQALETVGRCKAGKRAVHVLGDARDQIGSHADVERATPPVGHHADADERSVRHAGTFTVRRAVGKAFVPKAMP